MTKRQDIKPKTFSSREEEIAFYAQRIKETRAIVNIERDVYIDTLMQQFTHEGLFISVPPRLVGNQK